MTDNDIIKALECCIDDDAGCTVCPAIGVCQHDFYCPKSIALDLINRQKAEIEQWKEEANWYQNLWCAVEKDIQTVKAEAIKVFADRLKLDSYIVTSESQTGIINIYSVVTVNQIVNLVKEMVGDV